MKKLFAGCLSFAVVMLLFCLGPVGANASERPSRPEIPDETLDLEQVKPDDDLTTQDWYTVSTEYGTPVNKGDVYYPGEAPVDAYKNSSTIAEKLTRTWKTAFKAKVSATAGATLDTGKLNVKIQASSSKEITEEYEYSIKVEKTLKPGQGVQIFKIYRKYAVPTYKVTKYSASMGGGQDKVLTGNTIVYVPIGLVSKDY